MSTTKTVPQEEKPVRGELLTPDEVANLFRLSPKTIYVMAANGELPVHRVSSSLRFDSADVDDYLFYSKFNGGNLKLSSIDEEKLMTRVEDQLAHTRHYVEKIIKDTRRVKPMK